jgi:hypothetical protein
MIQAGVLRADDPVGLLEGLLAAKMHKSRRLCGAGRLVRLALEAVVPAGWFVDTQGPITLADSEPGQAKGGRMRLSRRMTNRAAANRSAVVPGLRRLPSQRSQKSRSASACW